MTTIDDLCYKKALELLDTWKLAELNRYVQDTRMSRGKDGSKYHELEEFPEMLKNELLKRGHIQ